jgi:hypothetical protein
MPFMFNVVVFFLFCIFPHISVFFLKLYQTRKVLENKPRIPRQHSLVHVVPVVVEHVTIGVFLAVVAITTFVFV